MKARSLSLISLIGFLGLSTNAQALDPFSLLSIGEGVSQIFGSSEVGGAVSAFSELYGEIDQDAEISEEGRRIRNDVEVIQSLANEAGYTAEEVEGLFDRERIEGIEGNIRQVTKAIRAGKRAAALVRRTDKRVQNAQIESNEIEKEQLSQMYKLVAQGERARLDALKRELKSEIDKQNQIRELRTEIKARGGREFKAHGVIAYPKTERVVESAIETAKRLRAPLFSLMLLVFLGRLIYYLFGLRTISGGFDLVRDTIVCSMLLMVFPELVRAISGASLSLADSVIRGNTVEIQAHILNPPDMPSVLRETKLFFLAIFQWVKALGFFIIDFIMQFGLAFLVMLFPIVIFLSQMMNFQVGFPVFLGMFITISLWPLFWNLVGVASEILLKDTRNSFGNQLYGVLLSVIQVVTPFAVLKLFSASGVFDSLVSKSLLTVASAKTGGGAAGVAILKGGFSLGNGAVNLKNGVTRLKNGAIRFKNRGRAMQKTKELIERTKPEEEQNV